MNNELGMAEPKSIYEELKQWVNANYDSYACGYTVDRSMGNYDDVFYDGDAYGTSWAAYYVGRILGMDLPAPIQYDEDE